MVAPPQGSGTLRTGVRLGGAKQDGPRRDWGAGCCGGGQQSLGPAASLSSKDLSISPEHQPGPRATAPTCRHPLPPNPQH